jgi:hypothetical protein
VSISAGAVDCLGVVARAEVLVEHGAVAALERLLAPVGVAKVVDLKNISSSIMGHFLKH